jgi:GNAT superfamily N-acetyltransferase
MNIRIEENALTPDIYEAVRKVVNFQKYDKADAEIALKTSLFTLVAYDGVKPIGIGRVVGDNRIAFLIKDVVVLPEYRHHQIGQLIMKSLLQYIEVNACPHPYVVLMASKHTEGFYEKFGFICRPNQDFGHGMMKLY